MIHEAYNKSEIARRYFELMGETLSRQEANNRFKMVKSPDFALLKKVIEDVSKEAKKRLSFKT